MKSYKDVVYAGIEEEPWDTRLRSVYEFGSDYAFSTHPLRKDTVDEWPIRLFHEMQINIMDNVELLATKEI